jgi:hypothetical protein
MHWRTTGHHDQSAVVHQDKFEHYKCEAQILDGTPAMTTSDCSVIWFEKLHCKVSVSSDIGCDTQYSGDIRLSFSAIATKFITVARRPSVAPQSFDV